MTEDTNVDKEKDEAEDDKEDEAEEADAEDARTTGQVGKNKVLLDPRTGKPLRDQTLAAKDTGYMGNHDMQDKTEKMAPDKPKEDDFAE